jgi:hypothetical protein
VAKPTAARSLAPVLRELAEAPRGLPDSVSSSSTERRLIRERDQIARRGQEALGELYEQTNSVFRQATGRVIGRTGEIRNEEHQALCSAFAAHMNQELARGLTQNYRLAEAQIAGVTAAPLPLSELPPRRSCVELRQLTLAERISGKAFILREEG